MSRIGAPRAPFELADPADKPGHARQRMSRVCLVCKHTFVSDWTGARVCDACKSRRAAMPDGAAPR
jgi:hypothetical protein